MKLPNYLTYELIRRLDRDAPEQEMLSLLAATGLDVEAPGPAPDFEAMEERFDGPCQTGSFILEGTLNFLGHQMPMHFRISYAGPIDHDDPLDIFSTLR